MILVIALLTPFTMSDSVSLFFAFRIIQIRLMLLSIVHGLNPNQKLKAILEGCANLDREYSRTRKYYQLTHDRLVQAELALRYWREQKNLFIWVPIPLFTCRTDFRCLELALIQEWQPRLNYPFICQFFPSQEGPP